MCVYEPIYIYERVGCVHMYEDIWERNKGIFTVVLPESGSQSQRRIVRILYFLLYILLHCLIFLNQVYISMVLIKCNCL